MTATQLQVTDHINWPEYGPSLDLEPSPPTIPFRWQNQPEPEPKWEAVEPEQELVEWQSSAFSEYSGQLTRDTIVAIDLANPAPAELPSLIYLRRRSHCRPAAWRWLRALKLRANRERPSRRHDDWHLGAITRFQEALVKCESDEDYFRVADCKPDLYAAFEAYYSAPESFRVELEARLLAQEDHEQIARKLAMSPDGIQWYERAFFNISDRLNAPGFVVRNCLDGCVHSLTSEEDLGVLIRLVGYRLGTPALDDVLYGFSRRERPDSRSDLAGVFDSGIFRQFRMKMALVVHLTRTDDPKAAARLFKLFLRLRMLEQHRARRQGEHAEITKNIDVAYDQLLATLAHADGPPGSEPWPKTNSRVSGNDQLGPIPNAFLPLAASMLREGNRR